MLREPEFEERLEERRDFNARFFDLRDNEERKEYTKVMDRIVSGLAVVHARKFSDPVGEVYLEWSDRCLVVRGGGDTISGPAGR